MIRVICSKNIIFLFFLVKKTRKVGDGDLFGRALLGLLGVAARLEGVGGVVAKFLEELWGNCQQVTSHELLDLAAVTEGGAHDLIHHSNVFLSSLTLTCVL